MDKELVVVQQRAVSREAHRQAGIMYINYVYTYSQAAEMTSCMLHADARQRFQWESTPIDAALDPRMQQDSCWNSLLEYSDAVYPEEECMHVCKRCMITPVTCTFKKIHRSWPGTVGTHNAMQDFYGVCLEVWSVNMMHQSPVYCYY